jgi:hypothetical protein
MICIDLRNLQRVQGTPSASRREAWLLRVDSRLFGLVGSGLWCDAKLLLCGSNLIALWKVEEKLGDRKTELVREQEGLN